MKHVTTYVGIDAHKKDFFIAMLVGTAVTRVTSQVANEPNACGLYVGLTTARPSLLWVPTGLWLQLVSQVVVLLLAAFITFVKFMDPSSPQELLPDSVLMYMSGGIGLVTLGVLFGVRRFCFDPASEDNAIIVEPT